LLKWDDSTNNFNIKAQIIIMKAQASLEMVVGLIILLVVAGVVIGLVLHFVNPKNIPNPREQIGKRDFQSKCESFCNDVSSVEYCRYFWGSESKGTNTNLDWNGDGEKNGIIKLGNYQWATCENRIFCFFIQPCERFGSGGLDTMTKCKRILCQTYIGKHGSGDEASRALHDAIDISQCYFDAAVIRGEITESDLNWYTKAFSDAEC